jgi:ATP-dependent Clp protease ATP-binding subunit ClpA
MSVVNLEVLVHKLDPESKGALEAALSMAVSYQHRSVMLAHWMYHLLQCASLKAVLFEVNAAPGILKKQLLNIIEAMPSDVDQAPTISQLVIDASCEAWVIASLEFNACELNPVFILFALMEDPMLRQSLLAILPEVKRIEVSDYKRAIKKYRPSMEDNKRDVAENKSLVSLEMLSKFTEDLTAKAREGKLDPVIGRDNEINQMIDVLSRRRQNNPILVGEPGVGKTAVVEGLALRVAQGDVGALLKNVAIRSLDLAQLQAGAGVKGEFEKRLTTLVKEVEASPIPIILFIDEAHNLVGAGGSSGQGDAANIMKPVLARGQLRTIAATTWREYKKYFESDAALVRRFQTVKINEPDEDTAIAMLDSLTAVLSAHHQLPIAQEAIEASVRLSHRYVSERQLPDKAISVLDTACARQARLEPGVMIKKTDIARVISQWTGVPEENMLASANGRLLDLESLLKERVIGQDAALTSISDTLRACAARLHEGNKPSGVFLLVGPSGVGKTETACALAEHVYGGEDKMSTINMSEFKEVHKVSTLVGAPPGYVGYGEGGVLTEAVRREPYSLVLFDEMEKAHASVQDVFYNMFDKGVLRDSEGRDVDFKNTVIIMTSNAASDFIANYDFNKNPDQTVFQKALSGELARYFKPAFLGRASLIPYFPLTCDVTMSLIRSQCQRLMARVQSTYAVKLTIKNEVYDAIAADCNRPEIGARQIAHIITQKIMPRVSKALLMNLSKKRPRKRLCLHVKNGGYSLIA